MDSNFPFWPILRCLEPTTLVCKAHSLELFIAFMITQTCSLRSLQPRVIHYIHNLELFIAYAFSYNITTLIQSFSFLVICDGPLSSLCYVLGQNFGLYVLWYNHFVLLNAYIHYSRFLTHVPYTRDLYRRGSYF